MTKRYTQSIERQNLNFRIRIKRLARKTLCFSKSIEIHAKVIGTFINRMLFNSSKAMTYREPQRLRCLAVVALEFERLVWDAAD